MKLFVLIVHLMMLCSTSWSQEVYRAILERDNLVFVETSLGLYRFSAFANQGVDVHFSHDVNIFKRTSLSTLEVHEKFDFVREDEQTVVLVKGNLQVAVQKLPFSIQYHLEDKHVLTQQQRIGESDSVLWNFAIDENEVLYGGGARALGMNRKGNRLELYNRAHYGYEERSELMNFSMPIVWGSSGFMLHFDNASAGYLDLDSRATNEISYGAVSGEHRYQVIVNAHPLGILKDYTTLTGHQSLPPIWALGNFASRFGYRSAREVLAVVDAYEKEKVPLDAVIIDLYWFGKTIQGTMGNLRFDLDSFPNPREFLAVLRSKNIQPIVITEPFILTTSSRWKEAVARDILCKDNKGKVHTYEFYFGNTGLIDVFNPKAQAWFWEIYEELHDLGVRGVWGDLGEPEVHPAELRHFGGFTADDIHNAYGHQWAKLIFEGYKRQFPEERLFSLMRAGAPGSQRYGMIPWSGDVNRSWGGLKSQPEIALQMGMQGMAYMHSDLGGFAGDYNDDELYIRWLQYGVFQPIFRPHAQDEVASEPVFKDKETLRIVKESIKLRYALLPYNYNLVLENGRTGAPLMRPLFFEAPEDSIAQRCSDTYFWGKDFLISPVLEKGELRHLLTLPPESAWFDFYSNKLIENRETRSQHIELEVDLSHIPTYVRAGSVIPMIPPISNTSDYKPEQIVWNFFLSSEVKHNTLVLHHDNLLPNYNPNYKSQEIRVSYRIRGRRVWIAFNDESGNPQTVKKSAIVLRGQPRRWKVRVNGRKVKL